MLNHKEFQKILDYIIRSQNKKSLPCYCHKEQAYLLSVSEGKDALRITHKYFYYLSTKSRMTQTHSYILI